MTKNVTQAVMQDLSPAFKSNSALGKATTRVATVLPKSPRKKRTVIHKLFQSYVSPSALPSASCSGTKPSCTSTLSEEVVTKVVNFYNQNDVSIQARRAATRESDAFQQTSSQRLPVSIPRELHTSN